MKESFSSQVKSIASTFGTNTIFVVGKGASVDEVNLAVLANNLVIGLNDSERITPCDITIFRDAWVHAAIEDNNCRSQLYICSTEFKASRGDVVKEQDVSSAHGAGTDMMMSRLLSESPGEMFAIESVLFISALRLARLIADQRQQKQTVYMIGFDFSVDKGYSKAVAKDYAPNQEGEHDASISPQECCFINALYMLRDSCLEVRHVGDRAFSSLTTEELNSLFLPELAEGTKYEQNRVLVIADLTTNHFGDRNRLERMVRSARAAGADLIKVHKRNVESFYSQEQLESKYMSPFGHTFRDYRHALDLSTEDFEFLDKLCNDLGIQWFASVLDEPSFRFMQQFELDLVKLPSTISEHTEYSEYVANNYKVSIVVSTGMTDGAYEDWLLQTFNKSAKLYLMQCNSAYPPSPLHDCDIGVIRHYHAMSQAHPHVIPAYSSHDFGWMVSALAVAAGAKMVEKHVMLGNTEWAHFDALAVDLTTSEFAGYVAKIREAEVIVGKEEKTVNQSEHHKYPKR